MSLSDLFECSIHNKDLFEIPRYSNLNCGKKTYACLKCSNYTEDSIEYVRKQNNKTYVIHATKFIYIKYCCESQRLSIYKPNYNKLPYLYYNDYNTKQLLNFLMSKKIIFNSKKDILKYLNDLSIFV